MSLYIKRALFTGKPDKNEPFVSFELFYNISLSLAIRIRRLIRNLVCAEVKRARQEAFHFHPRVRASVCKRARHEVSSSSSLSLSLSLCAFLHNVTCTLSVNNKSITLTFKQCNAVSCCIL